jgi:hypothetical protein
VRNRVAGSRRGDQETRIGLNRAMRDSHYWEVVQSVGRQVLILVILVQIQASQPNFDMPQYARHVLLSFFLQDSTARAEYALLLRH